MATSDMRDTLTERRVYGGSSAYSEGRSQAPGADLQEVHMIQGDTRTVELADESHWGPPSLLCYSAAL